MGGNSPTWSDWKGVLDSVELIEISVWSFEEKNQNKNALSDSKKKRPGSIVTTAWRHIALARHLRAKQALAKIREKFYWMNCREYVKKWATRNKERVNATI